MDRTSTLNSILSRQLGWIAAADAKSSFIFPVAAAMLGLLAALAPDKDSWTISAAIFSSLATLLLALSIIFCALAAFPRTKGPRGSNIYCDGIASKDVDQYLKEIKSLTDDSYNADLTRQCHVNATIASAKFKWIKFALGAIFAAAAPWVMSVYLLYGIV